MIRWEESKQASFYFDRETEANPKMGFNLVGFYSRSKSKISK